MSKKIDARIIRTKHLFREALLSLMLEKEYHNITVQEIAGRSTLNRATFYLHYYDKDELLKVILNEELDQLSKCLEVPTKEFTYFNSEPYPSFLRLFEQIYKSPTFYKIMLADKKVPYFTDQVLDELECHVKSSIEYLVNDNVQLSVPIEFAIVYIRSAYLGVIIWWLENDMPYTPKYMSAHLTKISSEGQFVSSPYIS